MYGAVGVFSINILNRREQKMKRMNGKEIVSQAAETISHHHTMYYCSGLSAIISFQKKLKKDLSRIEANAQVNVAIYTSTHTMMN